jgi:predicted Rossmann fold nucleotide-binding protein DprA/Smf involved in DNA uptake
MMRQAIFVDREDIRELVGGKQWEINIGGQLVPIIYDGKPVIRRKVPAEDLSSADSKPKRRGTRPSISPLITEHLQIQPTTTKSLSEATGYGAKQISNALTNLRKKGRVRRDSRTKMWSLKK